MNLEEALEILESTIGDKVKAYREAKKEAKKVAKAIDTYEEVHKGHNPTPYRGQLEVKLEDAKKGIIATKTNEALELMEAIISEAKYLFPKKAVEAGNKEFEKVDKENNSTNRLYRKSVEKLNKVIKKMKEEGKNPDAYKYPITRDQQQALETVKNLSGKKEQTEKEFDKVNRKQYKLAADNKGVSYREPSLYHSKKSDSFGWANKKHVSEALELMEAIINEVSVGALARAAKNNLPKRAKEEASAITKFEKAQDNYEEMSKKHPEEEPALYRKLQADDAAGVKASNRAEHAEDIVNLKLPKNSKVSANKLFKAAHKVEGKREKESENAVGTTPKNFVRKLDRSERADNIHFADPVKSRTNEALSIAEEMLQLANSIFEVAPEAPVSAEEVPPSNNEIKQTKKDKENPEKKREVVSVADELFPYEGNAKQQMNQKILAKINQMIEGTATLEDLLQLVRRGTKKAPMAK